MLAPWKTWKAREVQGEPMRSDSSLRGVPARSPRAQESPPPCIRTVSSGRESSPAARVRPTSPLQKIELSCDCALCYERNRDARPVPPSFDSGGSVLWVIHSGVDSIMLAGPRIVGRVRGIISCPPMPQCQRCVHCNNTTCTCTACLQPSPRPARRLANPRKRSC